MCACQVKGVKEEGDAALRCKMPDPDPETWSGEAKELVEKISGLSALRVTNPALTWGILKVLYVKNQELVFLRSSDTPARQMLIVAVNSGIEHQVIPPPPTLCSPGLSFVAWRVCRCVLAMDCG